MESTCHLLTSVNFALILKKYDLRRKKVKKYIDFQTFGTEQRVFLKCLHFEHEKFIENRKNSIVTFLLAL